MKENRTQEPINYFLKHSNATVDLALTNDRLIVNTQGKGLLDRLRTIDIPLSDLESFCLVPTIGAQNIIGRRSEENAGDFAYDLSYDSEFIFSYRDNGNLKKKRVFVNSRDEIFQRLLEALESSCPEASLLHLEPAEAQKQIGVISARKGVYIIIALLVGLPVIGALIMIIIQIVSGYK
jgi:hypothetical protein